MDENRYTDREEQKRALRRGMMVNTALDEEEDSQEDYEAGLRRHRRKRIWITVLLFLCALILLGIAAFLHFYRSYDHMEVLWSVTVEGSSYEDAVAFGSGTVKFGKDSASYIDGSGQVVWVESCEMSHPAAIVRGDYIALVDQGSNQVMICSTSGKLGQVTTASPISRGAIASQGMVVLILEDERANYLAFYDRTGKKLDIEIRTRLQGDGYPMDLALSPSGEQLMVSYVYVESGMIRNKVIFYNFDVGQDMVDRIVGGFEQYQETIIPRVAFMGESNAVAFGDNVISFYSMKNKLKPGLVKEISLDKEISAVLYNENHAGVVIPQPGAENPYLLTVYDRTGEIEVSIGIPMEFSKIQFVDNEILVYNKENLMIYSIDGKVKYSQEMTEDLQLMVYGGQKDRYMLISGGVLQAVELR